MNNKLEHFSDAYSTYVEVDLHAIMKNALAIKMFTEKKLIAVVKANAYGHGSVYVALALERVADMLAVATVEEGVTLRKAGVVKPILVLFSSDRYTAHQFIEYDLIPTISDFEFADTLNSLTEKKMEVHININTGLNRSGIDWKEADSLIDKIYKLRKLTVSGIFTHFATADEKDKTFVFMQIERFCHALSMKKIDDKLIHTANSAAIMAIPETYFDAVRPGLSLYGIYPSEEKTIKLEPVLTWKARIGWIENILEYEGIGYGLTYRTKQRSRVAMIHVGYSDGYPRSLSNNAEVLVNGNRRKVIGRVCMDISVILLDKKDKADIGTEVVLLGRQGNEEITANELAHKAGTIPYEIITQIAHSVPRIYK